MGFDPGRRRVLGWAAALAAGCANRRVSPPSSVGVAGAAGGRAAGARDSVIVVGGGLAGLTAAHDLMELGHEVRVLEANERVGGRILTIRAPWRDGLFVEAGATHVVGDPELLRLFTAMGVALEQRPQTRGLAQVSFVRGQRAVLPAGTRPPDDRRLRADEDALGEAGRMARYFAEATTWDPTGPIPAALFALDGVSGGEFLRRQGASAGFVDAVDHWLGLGDAGIEAMSALSLVHQWASIRREMTLGPSLRVAGGTDRLPAAIAARLGSRVLRGAAVTQIRQEGQRLRVAFVRRGEPAAITADRVVLAIPPKVLADLPVEPALSPEKRRALREIRLESVTRVWLQADRRFWIARGEAGRAKTDLPIGPVRDETEGLPGTAGVLGVYVTRAESRRLAGLSEDQRVGTLLSTVEQVHPGLQARFAGGASKSWDDDPFQRGAYVTFAPGQLIGLGPHLGRPEGRLHFAGDHTSHRPGFMHGALASARRVVAEIAGARP